MSGPIVNQLKSLGYSGTRVEQWDHYWSTNKRKNIYEVDLTDQVKMREVGSVAQLESYGDRISRFFLNRFATSRFDCIKNWAQRSLAVIGETHLRGLFLRNYDTFYRFATSDERLAMGLIPTREETAQLVPKFRVEETIKDRHGFATDSDEISSSF